MTNTTHSIIKFMTHPKLLGSQYPKADFANWLIFMKSAFGIPLDADELPFFTEHTGRTVAPSERCREVYGIIGRRGGKGRAAAAIAAFLATAVDWTPHLAAGEVATAAYIAADRNQAQNAIRYLKGIFRQTPALKKLVARETDWGLELKTRVVLEVQTCSSRLTRGYSYCCVIGDEACFWRGESSSDGDTEVLNAIRPGLATLPGSMLVVLSSPWSRRGAVYEAFRKHYGQNDSKVLVFKGATWDFHPAIDQAFIADAYERDPVAASAEFGGEFRSDLEQYITQELLDAAIVPGRLELPPSPLHQYHGFLDPAGGTGSDSFTMAIAHSEGERVVVDSVREARPPFDVSVVVKEFAAHLLHYGVHQAWADRYAAAFVPSAFAEHGVDVQQGLELNDSAALGKSDIYRNCIPHFTSGRVELLDVPRIATQFLGLERRSVRGGRETIDHRPGSHDDLCNSVAGAVVMAGQGVAECVAAANLSRESTRLGIRLGDESPLIQTYSDEFLLRAREAHRDEFGAAGPMAVKF